MEDVQENSDVFQVCGFRTTFADACSQKNAKIMQKQEKEEIAATPPLPEPKVSLKYPEFVHFKTIGILDGTDKGTWDDFWISREEYNIDKLREQHNTYLEDYFDMIDMSASIQREIEQPYEKEDIKTEIENFQDCVTFLDLIKEGRALNDKWETHRDRFNRITTCVQFEGDFEGLAEIFGLERSDGMDIKQCYLDYLEPLVSNYKAARPSIPTGGYGEEGIRRFDGYHGVGNMDGSLAAKEKVGVKHFGITLKEEKEGKNKGIAQRDDEYMARIKCYICERTGHFDSKCTMEMTKIPLMKHRHQDNKAKKILRVFQVMAFMSSFETCRRWKQNKTNLTSSLISYRGDC
ncbi:ARID DNA-binding domain-containing protein [Tanacetum coccineum]